jgi:hypothetical protein
MDALRRSSDGSGGRSFSPSYASRIAENRPGSRPKSIPELHDACTNAMESPLRLCPTSWRPPSPSLRHEVCIVRITQTANGARRIVRCSAG